MSWEVLMNLTGPQGPPGETGPQGPAGSDADITEHEEALDPHPQYAAANHNHSGIYQPADADLTAIADLNPSNNDVLQYKSGSWANRSLAQLASDMGLATTYQPLDSDLTDIAALNPSNDSFIQRKSGAWTSRTLSQVRADIREVKPYPPVDLVYSATIATDASLGTHFRCTLTGNPTFSPPTNPTDGQVIVYELLASGAARTPTFSSSTGGFSFGADITGVSEIASGKIDYIQFVYRGGSYNRWFCIGYVKGYG